MTSEGTTIRFRENGDPWRSLPPWARWLIDFGYAWMDGVIDGRSLPGTQRALVSMPCESPAAGLIALGAMRRRVEESGGREAERHYARLRTLASEGQRVQLRHGGQLYELDGLWRGLVDWPCATLVNNRQRRGVGITRKSIRPQDAAEWTIDGEPPLTATGNVEGATAHAMLLDALATRPVDRESLGRTDSAVCLGTASRGQSASRETLANTWIEANGEEASVATLLAIHRWAPGAPSRVSLFNTRTMALDRAGAPRLVIAEGTLGFLRVAQHEVLARSDLIGVYSRAEEREALEDLGNWEVAQRQWFAPTNLPNDQATVPTGIGVLVVARRRTG